MAKIAAFCQKSGVSAPALLTCFPPVHIITGAYNKLSKCVTFDRICKEIGVVRIRKVLSLVSILMLAIGIFTLVTGLLDVGLLLGSGGGAVAEALAGLAVVMFVVGGLLDIIGGLLGLRAARTGRAGAAIVFGLLGLVAGVISVVLDFSVANICTCVIPLIYFLCAIAARSGSR